MNIKTKSELDIDRKITKSEIESNDIKQVDTIRINFHVSDNVYPLFHSAIKKLPGRCKADGMDAPLLRGSK